MTDQAYLTRKLKHYNEWLLDEKREFGKPYPGFPEDNKPARKKANVTIAPVAPVKREKGKKMNSTMNIEATGVKVAKLTRGPKAGTKQAKAIEIVRAVGVDNKAAAIDKIVAELSMSKAGATTYFHNAKNRLALGA